MSVWVVHGATEKRNSEMRPVHLDYTPNLAADAFGRGHR
jgi:hypothetical protein